MYIVVIRTLPQADTLVASFVTDLRKFVLYPFHICIYGCLLHEHVLLQYIIFFYPFEAFLCFRRAAHVLYWCRLFSFTLKSYDYGLVQLQNLL